MRPFSALSSQQKLVEVARWLCVPVACVAVVIVLILLGEIAMPRQYVQPPGAPPPPAPAIPRVVTFRVFSVVMAVALILAGAKTAPRYRLIVALLLAGLWLSHAFLFRIYVHLGRGAPHYFDFALSVAAAAAAVALIYYTERRRAVPAAEL